LTALTKIGPPPVGICTEKGTGPVCATTTGPWTQ
jgi:hypothetical protein